MSSGVYKPYSVQLDLVSPMLLRGAENTANSAPEMRAPAFRGAMRYWLRACAGGVIGDDNLAGLHQLETAIFGDTKTGSAIVIRVLRSEDQPITINRKYLLPHKNEGSRYFFTGGSIQLEVRPRQLMTEENWQAITAVTRLFIALGAVGSRSRRGYGGLQPTEPAIVGLRSWNMYIQETVSNAVQAVGVLAGQLGIAPEALPAGPCAFPCASTSARIRLLNHVSLNADAEVTWLMQQVQANHGDWIGFVHGGTRQASPMHARVVKMHEGYRTQLVTLPSRFNHANYHELNAFIDNLPGIDIRVEGWNQ